MATEQYHPSTNWRFCETMNKLRHFCDIKVRFEFFIHYSFIEALLYRIGKKLKSSICIFHTVECSQVAGSFLPKFLVRRYSLLALEMSHWRMASFNINSSETNGPTGDRCNHQRCLMRHFSCLFFSQLEATQWSHCQAMRSYQPTSK